MTEEEQMLTAVLNCRQVDLYVQQPVLTEQQRQRLNRMKIRRENGEPLQYVLGETSFMGFDFKVDPRVLIPRPETELLGEAVLKILHSENQAGRDWTICDLGTGSGSIAVSLAVLCPQARVTAVDISTDALSVAQANAARHQVTERVHFVPKDMIEFLNTACRWYPPFDMIISNPPYVATADLEKLPVDVRQEPQLALDGGPQGTKFHRAIIQVASSCLKAGGHLFLEIGDGQAVGLADFWRAQEGWKNIQFINDYTGTARIATGERQTH